MVDTFAIEALRDFAFRHDEVDFSYLCLAAIAGEEWAVERVEHALDLIVEGDTLHGEDEPSKLRIIRATDTTRPDGAIARSFEV